MRSDKGIVEIAGCIRSEDYSNQFEMSNPGKSGFAEIINDDFTIFHARRDSASCGGKIRENPVATEEVCPRPCNAKVI